MLPVLLGVKITLKVHLAAAARVVPHGDVVPGVTEKSMLPVKDKEVSGEPELFVKVSVWAGLGEPTGCDAKVRLVGAMATGRTAVPVRFTTCWSTDVALSEITSAP
jgi:hypothetical protein